MRREPTRSERRLLRCLAAGTLSLLAACSGGGGPSAQVVTPLPVTPSKYLPDLKTYLADNTSAIESDLATGDAGVYYATSYYLQGLAAGAEATGDVAVMDALVGFLIQQIGEAKPVVRNGVTYQEWGPFASDGTPGLLNTFQAAGPLARTVAIIAANPVFKARYAAQAATLTAFVDQAIFKFWFDKQTGYYSDPGSAWLGGDVPWLPLDLGGWGTFPIQVDTCSHFGMISTWMYQATGDALYKEYATRVAKGFRTHITVQGGSWVWDKGIVPIVAGDNQEGSPDTSHANREAMMVVAMYEAGIEFGSTDLAQLTSTFTQVIWNQDETNPMFANYIDGSNLVYRAATAWQNGVIFSGWDMLGRHSAEAQKVLALSYEDIKTVRPLNPSLDTNSNTYGLIELSGTLAWNALP